MYNLKVVDPIRVMHKWKSNENVTESDIEQFRDIMADYYTRDKKALDWLMLMRMMVIQWCEQSRDPVFVAISENVILKETDQILRRAIKNYPAGATVTKEDLQHADNKIVLLQAEIITTYLPLPPREG